MQEVWVWSLVSDLRFHMLWVAVKIFLKRKKKKKKTPFSTGVVEIGLRAWKGPLGMQMEYEAQISSHQAGSLNQALIMDPALTFPQLN